MRQPSTYLRFSGILLFFITSIASASPWFTGPLLAASGRTIPLGHVNLETIGFYTRNIGVFNRHWKLVHTPGNYNVQLNTLLSYGFSNNMDVQYNIPYTFNHNMGQNSRRIGDASILLGFQALRQRSIFHPDLRITLQETFPTGRFDDLNPLNQGTDGTGMGSYQTALGLNFQNLSQLGRNHHLRSRLSINYLYASKVHIHGLSSYGGTINTQGQIRPGNLLSIDLAEELSLTQHWVLVMEAYYLTRHATSFKGRLGDIHNGDLAMIGHGTMQEITLAPAIEYNFSEHYGILAGCWFIPRGKNTTDFISGIIAFNAYW